MGLFGIASAGAQPVLIWADEFEVNGLPDPGKWLYDVGGDGWGNGEEQYYTEARLENARVEDGFLIIEAREEAWPAGRNPENDYTSARLLTKGFGDWLYGRIEVRAKLPAGRGTWPAIWMLSTGQAYGTWPRSGEIDIMEHVGFDLGTIHGSLHSLENNWLTETQPTGSTMLPDVDTAFHDYAVEWSPEEIRFLVDGEEYFSYSNPQTGWEAWPFDQPFHLILNLAVGGFWGGQEGIDPDIWPAQLVVDYVRVYDIGETIPLDTDGDQIPNALDPDDDDDGLSDIEEHEIGTNLLNADTDGDGFSDFEEVEAGTFPLLKGSFPGSDASILLINNDFEYGAEPWIVHTNKLTAEGNWAGQAGSWGGAYSVFDFVTPKLDGEVVFTSYRAEDAPQAEHLLYQEWKATILGFQAGDVIRFRGTARAEASADGMVTQAFIRVLDGAFQKLPASVETEIGPEAASFSLKTTLGESQINVVQVGVSIQGPQTESAAITFSGLEATLNEETWADWPVANDYVDTGDWLGYLNVGYDPLIWSYRLQKWIFLPEDFVGPSGAWIYLPKE